MDALVSQALRQRLADLCTPDAVRAVEDGGSPHGMWQAIEDSGFANALRDEAHGGAGLALTEALPLFALCGEFALPLPLADTLLARALLDAAGLPVPTGAITLAQARQLPDGALHCDTVRYARTTERVLAVCDVGCILLPAATAQTKPSAFVLDAQMHWPAAAVAAAPAACAALPALAAREAARLWEALICASLMNGALQRVLAATLDYANQRLQFGKPIGKFQAIQHQLSVMAEQVYAAGMAAALAGQDGTLRQGPHPLRVALAKSRCSEAALEVASLAHAIHGAIGFTAAFDLQLFTRRLHAWRQCAGAESYWHDRLGQALLSHPSGLTLDLLRALG